MLKTNLIFDLDGTLVNSFNGIRFSFDAAYKHVYHLENTFNIEPFVGPPVNQILWKVRPDATDPETETFVSYFKKSYDSDGFQKSELYSGVVSTLSTLRTAGYNLYVATNKRANPTRLILDMFEISGFFQKVYCVDHPVSFADKTAMIDDLLTTEQIDKETVFYIGDTVHDLKASVNNGIEFIYASYGYGQFNYCEKNAYTFSDILKLIK